MLVSAATALRTKPTLVDDPSVNKIGGAPKFKVRAGAPVKLLISVPKGETYQIKLKIDGKYYDLGVASSGADGVVQVPTFRAGKPGMYIVALVNPKTGDTFYVKVFVR